MRTALLFYLDRWRGPIISNAPTNELLFYLIDQSGFDNDFKLMNWFWSFTDM